MLRLSARQFVVVLCSVVWHVWCAAVRRGGMVQAGVMMSVKCCGELLVWCDYGLVWCDVVWCVVHVAAVWCSGMRLGEVDSGAA